MNKQLRHQSGFTIIEILVATTLFAFTAVALTTLFNYTLKINRKAEALRQATQSTRDVVELMAKEIRNGQIDYGVLNGQTIETQNGQCPIPFTSNFGVNPIAPPQDVSIMDGVASSYSLPDNRLGVLDVSGDRWCFYLGDASGNYIGQGVNSGKTAVVVKNGTSPQVINPPNQTLTYLAFIIQPICDPYILHCADYGDSPAKQQPVVTILATFSVTLPTGEKVSIPYQTTVSTDRYDVLK